LEWEAGESPDPPGSWRELADLRQFSISAAEIPADEGGIDRDILAYQTSVTALSISEDGRWLVAADDDGGMWLWDLPAANLKRSWFADSSLVRACAVSAHAGLVLTGGVDSHLKLWDLETGNLLASLRGHTGQVMEMVINEDGSRAVTSGGAGSLIVWDLEAGRTVVPRPTHRGKVQAICFSPDGSQALSGGEDGSLLLWEVGTGQTLGSWSHPFGEVSVVGFTPQGQLLSGGRDGHLYLWEPGTREPVDSWECPMANDVDLQILGLSATEERILVVSAGYYDEFFVIWQMVDGVPAVLYQGDQRVRHAMVSDDTQTAVLFGDQIYLWQAGTFQEINAVTGDYYTPDAAVLSTDSQRVYMGNLYGQIGVLNPIVDGGYYLLGAHTNYVNALALSPDERYLVTGGWDTTLRIWDLDNGVEVGRYTWELPLEAAAAHYDGKALRIVVGDKHGSLLFFTLQVVEYPS
jgi:WD40 repeat protein